MNHFGLKKASSWTQVSSVRAKRPFIYLPWARHSVGTGAEPTCDGCGRNFSIVALDAGADDDEAAADGGKCVAAWAGGWRRDRYAVQRPPRCLSRTDHFPFGARHSAETSAELNMRLGCGRIFPRGQQAGATGEEAAEGRKCDGGAMGTKSTRDVKSVRHSKFCRCSDLGDGER